jgi:hypothetical protein
MDTIDTYRRLVQHVLMAYAAIPTPMGTYIQKWCVIGIPTDTSSSPWAGIRGNMCFDRYCRI